MAPVPFVACFLPLVQATIRGSQEWILARRSYFALAMFIGVTVSSSCSAADRGKSVAQVSKPIGAGSPAKADAKLEQAVRAGLAADQQLRSVDLQVKADVTKNQVTLSGVVGSEALKQRAGEIAKEAHAGVLVENQIQVKRAPEAAAKQ
jgi:osmotically-inducible protein OsmY